MQWNKIETATLRNHRPRINLGWPRSPSRFLCRTEWGVVLVYHMVPIWSEAHNDPLSDRGESLGVE